MVKPCADVVTKGRGVAKAARTPLIYDLQHARRPQAAARQLLMYDVGCTTYDLDYSAPAAREFCEAGADEMW